MSRATEDVLHDVVKRDGGRIQILVHREAGAKNDPRFVARSLRYGLIATAATGAGAVRRVLDMVVAHLVECEEQGVSSTEHVVPASAEVLRAFDQGYPIEHGLLHQYFDTRTNHAFEESDLVEVRMTERVLEPVAA